jgi:hypothetical protein
MFEILRPVHKIDLGHVDNEQWARLVMKKEVRISLVEALNKRLGDPAFVASPPGPDPSKSVLDRILEKHNQVRSRNPVVQGFSDAIVEPQFRVAQGRVGVDRVTLIHIV